MCTTDHHHLQAPAARENNAACCARPHRAVGDRAAWRAGVRGRSKAGEPTTGNLPADYSDSDCESRSEASSPESREETSATASAPAAAGGAAAAAAPPAALAAAATQSQGRARTAAPIAQARREARAMRVW